MDPCEVQACSGAVEKGIMPGEGVPDCPAPSVANEERVWRNTMATEKTGLQQQWPLRPVAAVYLVVAAVSGPFFFNWPPAQQLLLRAGAYHWLCDDDTLVHGGGGSCVEQAEAVRALMPAGVASMFIFAFFGGLTLDYGGPKLAALLGLALQISGWLLLCFGRPSLRSTYLIATVLMGLGNDPTQFALLNGANRMPRHRTAAIGILMATRTLGFAVPSVLNALLDAGWTLQVVCLSYTGILVACAVAACVVFPWRPVPHPQRLAPQPASTAPDSFYLAEHIPLPDKKTLDKLRRNSAISVASTASSSSPTGAGGYKLCDGFRPSRVIPKDGYCIGPLADDDAAAARGGCSAHVALSSSLRLSSQQNRGGVSNQQKSTARRLQRWLSGVACRTRHDSVDWPPGAYLPLFPLAATTILCATFSGNTVQEQLRGDVLAFSTTIAHLALIPGFLISLLAESRGPLFAMLLTNGLQFLQFFLLLLLNDGLPVVGYPVAVVNCVVASFFLAQFYCYTGAYFPHRWFGSLTGTLILCSGIFSLIATPMCDFSSFESNFGAMNGLCFAVTVLNFGFLRLLYNAHADAQKPTDMYVAPAIVEP